MRRRFKRRRFIRRRRTTRRFGRRRFGGRSRRTFKRVARQVRHLVKAVELKHTIFVTPGSFLINNLITSTTQTSFLWQIPQGTSIEERIGHKCFIKYIDFRASFHSGTGASANKQFINLYVVRRKHLPTTTVINPTTSELWNTLSSNLPLNNFRTFSYRNDYHIVWQKRLWVDPTTVWANERRIFKRLKINKPISWIETDTGGTLAGLRQNAYWLIIRGDSVAGATNPLCTELMWSIRFTDF